MTQPHLNKEQVDELYKTVAEGITRLSEQSQACGDDADLNPARVRMVALAGYLAENEILDILVGYAQLLEDPSLLEECSSSINRSKQ
jgi:hypothetical protein